MKNNVFTGIILILCLVVGSIGDLRAQDLNVNGKWVIDKNDSDFGGLSPAIAAPVKISTSIVKDSIVVSRLFEGKELATEKLKFSDEAIESFPDGNTKRLASVKYSDDKKSVVFDMHYEVNGKEWEYHRTETWKLSLDGKELTVERVTTLPNKVDKVRAVYTKEK